MGGVRVAVVVIGRCEERNLERCFASLRALDYSRSLIEIVYVDSASTDRSLEIAQSLGIPAICLSGDSVNAARGRQAGWRATSAPIILFVDGDCSVDPGFLRSALGEFADPSVGVVCGGLSENYHFFTQYMLALRYRNLGQGDVPLMGGNYLCRRSVLEELDGFDVSLESGENTEFGNRLHRAGYKSLRLRVPMVIHQPKFQSWRDIARRALRFGYGDARLFLNGLAPASRLSQFVDLGPRIGDAASVATVGLAAAATVIAAPAIAPVVAVGALGLSVAAKAYRSRHKDLPWKTLLAYGLFIQGFSLLHLAGMSCCLLDQITGSHRTFVDHNHPVRVRRNDGLRVGGRTDATRPSSSNGIPAG